MKHHEDEPVREWFQLSERDEHLLDQVALLEFAQSLGFIETQQMAELREHLESTPNSENFKDAEAEYKELSLEPNQTEDILIRAKRQVGLYMMLAKICHARHRNVQTIAQIDQAEAYAREIAEQAGPEFAPVLERLKNL